MYSYGWQAEHENVWTLRDVLHGCSVRGKLVHCITPRCGEVATPRRQSELDPWAARRKAFDTKALEEFFWPVPVNVPEPDGGVRSRHQRFGSSGGHASQNNRKVNG
jgi:hypothetical protein